QFRPARRTQALAVDRLAAGGAQRRQRQIERAAQHGARSVGGLSEARGQGDAGGVQKHPTTLPSRDALVIADVRQAWSRAIGFSVGFGWGSAAAERLRSGRRLFCSTAPPRIWPIGSPRCCAASSLRSISARRAKRYG